MPPDSHGRGGGSGGGTHGGGGGAGGGAGHTDSPPALPPPASSFAPGSICEADGWCWYDPLPTGSDWAAVAGAGRTDLWIGGFTQNLLQFDGGRWRLHASPLSVRSIWAASDDDVWFGGSGGDNDEDAAIAHWDGVAVTQTASFGFGGIEGVWGSGASDVYAVGFLTLQHWNGSAWSEVPGVTGRSVSGTGPNDVWVGGSAGLFHFDGSTWSAVAGFEGLLVYQVTAAASDDVWARTLRDGDQTIERFDGVSWSVNRKFIGADVGLTDLHTAPGQGVWLTGSDAQAAFIDHFDGASWTRGVNTGGPIVGTTAGFGVIGVGGSGSITRLAADPVPRVVENLRVGPTATLRGTFGTSPTDMWAVGDAGTVLHYDGRSVVVVPSGTTADLTDVWGTAPGDVWAVGRGGTIVHYDGRVFSPVASGSSVDLHAVFAAGRDDVWIGGDAATLLHWGGINVVPVALAGINPLMPIVDLHGVAANDIWLSGGRFIFAGASSFQQGFVAHYDGTLWSPVEVLTFDGPPFTGSPPIVRIWELTPNDVWALTEQTASGGRVGYWHFDGATWTGSFMVESPATFMFPLNRGHGTFVFGPHDRWAVGAPGVWQRSTQ